MKQVLRAINIILALCISFLLWYSIKLISIYKTNIDIPVKFEGAPHNIKLNHPLPEEFQLTLSGKGKDLLFYSLFSPDTAVINLKNYMAQSNISTQALNDQLKKIVSHAINIENIRPDSISLNFERKIAKRVPVSSQFELIYPDGHYATSPPIIDPPMVTILGTPDELHKITKWDTQTDKINLQVGDHEAKVDLSTDPDIIVSEKTVKIYPKYDFFTEGTFQRTVHPLNPPYNSAVRFLPVNIKVTFLAPFGKFEQARPQDFHIVADMRQIDENTQYIIPVVVKKPDFVRGVRLDPPYIRFVVSMK